MAKQFQSKQKKSKVRRHSNTVALKKTRSLLRAFELLADLPDDMFPAGRKDDPPQRRASTS